MARPTAQEWLRLRGFARMADAFEEAADTLDANPDMDAAELLRSIATKLRDGA